MQDVLLHIYVHFVSLVAAWLEEYVGSDIFRKVDW